MNRLAHIEVALLIFSLWLGSINAYGDEGQPLSPNLDRIWKSFVGSDLEYDKFYRITVYSINSPVALLGLFVKDDKINVSWAYTEYEKDYQRNIIAIDFSDFHSDRVLLHLQQIEKSETDDAKPILDGYRFVLEIMNKDREIDKTHRWSYSGSNLDMLPHSVEAEIFSLWNKLPNTKDIP